ncbi:MAG TPA: anthranilate phosphoribosyltransferase, partial [Candidatus Synoicihabitans sp.]|nr:anthranilate phosphoribosyltransferase [Candidatus Synoicihabitans sp.]
DVLDLLGMRAGIVGHGIITTDTGIDEITTATSNRVRGVGRLREIDATWQGAEFGLEPASFNDLRGGDLPHNLGVVDAVLSGRGPRGLVDTIALNAAVALWVMGRAVTIVDAVESARETLVGGAVRAKIAATREFFAAA